MSRRLGIQEVMTTVSFYSHRTMSMSLHYLGRVDCQIQAWILTCCRFSMCLRIHTLWRAGASQETDQGQSPQLGPQISQDFRGFLETNPVKGEMFIAESITSGQNGREETARDLLMQ